MNEEIKEEQDVQNIQEIIAKEFGFDDVSDDSQKELIEHMTESVIKRVLVDSYEKLSEDDKKIFEEMMEDVENIDPNKIDEFLREKLSDYDKIVNTAIEDLKNHLEEVNNVQ